MSAGTEDRIINQMADDTGDEELVQQQEGLAPPPVYKVFEGTRVPVSKKAGTTWKSRRDAAQRKLEQTGRISNWEEAIRYYKNDQRANREGRAAKTRKDRGRTGRESENVVFANTSALVPSIYAKNPTCEVTSNVRDDQQEGGPDDYMKRCATVAERLVNTLSSRRAAPGINLKPKARKAVIMSILTNISYLEVGYTFREQSSEEALRELDRIAQEYASAEESKDIERLEGELEALEERVEFLNPSGPWVKFRHPKDVLNDPDAMEADLSDARWIMVAEYLPTVYLNAVYRMKEGEEWRSLYKPTHVVATDTKGIDEEINSFSLLKGKTDYRSYGFTDEDSFNKATRTKVWKVWDRISRRVFMYSDEDWTWPIWVWDDPYNLDTFFPLFPLQFYTDPEDDIGQSEVMYYLDQQDGINEVNAELGKIRRKLMGTIFYNKNIMKDASVVDAYIKGESLDQAIPVDAPPDANLQQAFFALLPPSAANMQLFQVFRESLNAAIQRVSSVQPVMQGSEFKTNTTNEAIDTYNSTQQTRLDEKIDAVEDLVGGVLWAVIQMCMQFMPQEEVAAVLGPRDAEHWRNLSPAEIRTAISVRVVGGSSQKPTAKVKKQEALQMVQGLGQFAQAGQGVVIIKMLEVMSRAYDELTISEEDWDFLKQAIMQSIQNSNPQGAGPGGQPGQGEPPTPTGDPLQELAAMVDQLPPEAKMALGRALANGAPVQEALPQIMEMVQGQADQQSTVQ